MKKTSQHLNKLIPMLLIVGLISLNIVAYSVSKSYFKPKDNPIEVEELSDTEQGDFEHHKLLSWTYELLKSFRD
jgi:hypothetical protein